MSITAIPVCTLCFGGDGWKVNRKLVYRIYKEEGLQMRRKRPRRNRSCQIRVQRPTTLRADESWSVDFMSDQLFSGQRFPLLTLVDYFTRESLAVEVGDKVTRIETLSLGVDQ